MRDALKYRGGSDGRTLPEMWDHHPVLQVLLAVFALTVVAWLLAAFVPFFQGFHYLAMLGLRFSFYLLAIGLLLHGFRRFFKTTPRSRT